MAEKWTPCTDQLLVFEILCSVLVWNLHTNHLLIFYLLTAVFGQFLVSTRQLKNVHIFGPHTGIWRTSPLHKEKFRTNIQTVLGFFFFNGNSAYFRCFSFECSNKPYFNFGRLTMVKSYERNINFTCLDRYLVLWKPLLKMYQLSRSRGCY